MAPQLVGHRASHVTPLVVAFAIAESGGHAVETREAWLEDVTAHKWRSDVRDRVLRVAKVLELNADQDMLAAPGIDNLARITGLGRRQVFRILARLRSTGFLGWVSTGSTSGRRWRATYVLTTPVTRIEKVSPRRDLTPKTVPCARETSWRDSKACQWVRRRYAAGWTDRQFRTALEYPVDMSEPYGSPEGRSLWRVLQWRILQRRGPRGEFLGPEALFAKPVGKTGAARLRRADWDAWEAEVSSPGGLVGLTEAIQACKDAVRHARADMVATQGGGGVASKAWYGRQSAQSSRPSIPTHASGGCVSERFADGMTSPETSTTTTATD